MYFSIVRQPQERARHKLLQRSCRLDGLRDDVHSHYLNTATHRYAARRLALCVRQRVQEHVDRALFARIGANFIEGRSSR